MSDHYCVFLRKESGMWSCVKCCLKTEFGVKKGIYTSKRYVNEAIKASRLLEKK